MAAKKQAKVKVDDGLYTWGDAPDAECVYIYEYPLGLEAALSKAEQHVDEWGDADTVQCVYRLVPVKIVRRAGVIVEDVS